jgi:hypothetical protein
VMRRRATYACVPLVVAAGALMVSAIATRPLAAQQPTPPAPPAPTPRDTTRPTPSDSAARDSVITRILEQDSSGTVRPGSFRVLGLDRLRLRTAGATAGWAWPGQALPARLYSLHADYGEVWSGVRVVFNSAYWTSRYRDGEVARLAREVGRVTSRDSAAIDTVRLGRISVADLSTGVDLRWQPGVARRASALARVVRPWVGGGVAAHFVNVEGAPVSGTFLERALDAAAIGLDAVAGLDLQPLPNFQMTVQARYDFLSTVRYASARAGASFVFGPAGREGTR